MNPILRIASICALAAIAQMVGAAELAVTVPPKTFAKDFGAVDLGAVLKLTVSSPCKLTGQTGGGIWVGGSATFVDHIVFTGSVPKDVAGVHVGTFSGKYRECGSGGNGPPPENDWSGKATDKSGIAVLLSDNPCEDSIVVVLQKAGTVHLVLAGTPNYELLNEHREVGSHTESFKFPTMPEGIYTAVNMTFTPDGGGSAVTDSVPARFRNLGMTRHSVYNVPDENDPTCQAGAMVAVNVDNGPDPRNHNACTADPDQLHGKFVRRMDLNGTGNSIHNGLIGREYLCPDVPAPKYRRKSAVTGSCGSTLDASSVAVFLADGTLACGDNICIDPGGKKLHKVVRDNCPACNGGHHIDNFMGLGTCGPAADLGNFITIKALP